jgi:hypothetical protein
MNRLRQESEELEGTLAICGPGAARIAGEVAGLTALGGYRLRARPEATLGDSYWDLPGGALRALGCALRIRRTGGTTLLALKGPTRPAPGGSGVVRRELEGPWSAALLGKVLAALREDGLALPDPGGAELMLAPDAVLARLGLLAVQERTTRRTPRDVLAGEARSTEVIAELAVDDTEFVLGGDAPVGQQGVRLRHCEIEVEAKALGGEAALRVLLEALLRRYGTSLRPWDHGKLATGIALGALYRSGRLPERAAGEGTLDGAGYDLLAGAMGTSPGSAHGISRPPLP